MSDAQASSAILLVRPCRFGFHDEAAASNAFAAPALADGDVAKQALREFDGLAERLSKAGVEVLILEDSPDPAKPDAAFPNNWVSFHGDGTMVLYPMATKARRPERDVEGLNRLLAASGFEIRQIIDLSFHERSGHYLEGTGSLVLDRPNRRAFANRSPRTDPTVIADFDDRLGYSTLLLNASDRAGRPIYHTNVMLSLGTRFAVACTGTLGEEYRPLLVDEIEASGRELIDVGHEQMRTFACNLIELLSRRTGEPLIALSSQALASLSAGQRRRLERFGELISAPIPTIETVGGGSVRCMVADVHLPRVNPAL